MPIYFPWEKRSKKSHNIELERYEAQTERQKIWLAYGTRMFNASIIGLIIFKVIGEMKSILLHDPNKITALSQLIDSLNLGTITGALVSLGLGAVYYRERKGKQRAIKEKQKYQKIAEAQDAYRSSSGLTPIGTTPKEGDLDD